MTKTTMNKRRSLGVTLGVHAGLVALALIPITSEIQQLTDEPEYVMVPVVFTSADEPMRSSGKTVEVPRKVDAADLQVETDVTDMAVEEEIIEQAVTEEEIITTDESEIQTSEPQEVEEAQIAEVGSESSDAEAGGSGDLEGTGSGDGREYVGVITRKVIYRADIAEAAENSGTIAVDVCINRQGRILEIGYNVEKTTTSDMDMVRHALDIASQYRFAPDFEAAYLECGTMTFIFDVTDSSGNIGLLAAN